jgi:hypothetical protein
MLTNTSEMERLVGRPDIANVVLEHVALLSGTRDVRFHLPAKKPVNWTDVFVVFPQYFQLTAGIIFQIMPWQLPFT